MTRFLATKMKSESKHAQEIESILSQYPLRTSKHVPEDYIGGRQSKLKYLGVTSPNMKHAGKAGFSFSHLPWDKQAEIWNEVWWSSNCYEVMSLAIDWFYQPQRLDQLPAHWPMLRDWSERIDNWAHSDGLSGLYSRIHESVGRPVLEVFKQWNSSSNPWLRRQSIVSLFYYSAHRNKQPKFTTVTSLLKPQLEFDHHYVQKGVGWTLRESGNVYPEETFAFIKRNISKISSKAFSAATEKMPLKQKQSLKKLRGTRFPF